MKQATNSYADLSMLTSTNQVQIASSSFNTVEERSVIKMEFRAQQKQFQGVSWKLCNLRNLQQWLFLTFINDLQNTLLLFLRNAENKIYITLKYAREVPKVAKTSSCLLASLT